MTTNRSNRADKPVRVMVVYASGKVKQRAVRSANAAAPWERGSAWGRAGAHALPDAGPGEAATPAVKVKDPRKVAAGKARAAQAAQRKADALNGKAAPAAKSPKPATKPKKVTTTKAAKKAAKNTPMRATAKALTAAAAKKPAKAREAKPKNTSGNAMVVIAFRGTNAQKKKFAKLGGGEWARKRIDAANA